MQTTRLCTLGVFSTDQHVLPLHAGVAQLGDGRGGVGQQALLEGGIDPGPCHHARAVARADLVFVSVDQRIERRGIHQPLFHQQGFQRFDAQGGIGGHGLVFVIVGVGARHGSRLPVYA